jgi:Holliday junction resolvasome RuvABC DNA-binding subunit
VSDLMVLVDEIVPFHLQHNAEAEAVDLLVEVQQLPKLLKLPYIDEKNYERVCLYLIRLADYMVRAASAATAHATATDATTLQTSTQVLVAALVLCWPISYYDTCSGSYSQIVC